MERTKWLHLLIRSLTHSLACNSKDGPSLIYPLAVANHKCPQHMLAFYERHLKFTNPKRDMSKVSPSGKSKRR